MKVDNTSCCAHPPPRRPSNHLGNWTRCTLSIAHYCQPFSIIMEAGRQAGAPGAREATADTRRSSELEDQPFKNPLWDPRTHQAQIRRLDSTEPEVVHIDLPMSQNSGSLHVPLSPRPVSTGDSVDPEASTRLNEKCGRCGRMQQCRALLCGTTARGCYLMLALMCVLPALIVLAVIITLTHRRHLQQG